MVDFSLSDPAYCGLPPGRSDIWLHWNGDPLLLILTALGIAAAVRMRSPARAQALVGVALLVLLFISPLCSLAVALFAVRTIQHLVVMLLAAPFIALSLDASGPRLGQWAARWLVPVTLLKVAVLVAWHVPAIYDPLLGSGPAYLVMNALLFVSAVLFWAGFKHSTPVLAIWALVLPMAAMATIGALLVLAPHPLYLRHAVAPFGWGLSPISDQQLAGLLMWVGATPAYLVLALTLFRPWHATESAIESRAAWPG